MNIEDFRGILYVVLKECTKKCHFQTWLTSTVVTLYAFMSRISGSVFVNIELFDFCCIKCDPDESGELQTSYIGIKPGWHMNKKYWISVYFNQDVPDGKIKELVSKSYDIVVRSLTKKEREML